MAKSLGVIFETEEQAEEYVRISGIEERTSKYQIEGFTRPDGCNLFRVKVPTSVYNWHTRSSRETRGKQNLCNGIQRNKTFSADEYYISISKEVGSKMSKLGVLHSGINELNDADFEDLRKVLVAGLSTPVTEYVEFTELHNLIKVNVLGRDFYMWVITKYGSPSGEQKRTVTIRDIAIPDEIYNSFGIADRRRSFLYEIMFKLKKEFISRVNIIRQHYDTNQY